MSNTAGTKPGSPRLRASKADSATDPAASGVGEQLRLIRRQRGLTLAQVADATKISKSFLSLVEARKSDITIGRLIRLVRFYGISVTDLLPEMNSSGRVGVVRSDQRRVIVSPAEGIKDFLLAPNTNGSMLPVLGTFEPGGRNIEPAEHEGEEFVYVLKGSVVAEIEGHDSIVLREGDSLYFSAEIPHTYANTAGREARVLFVISPPHL